MVFYAWYWSSLQWFLWCFHYCPSFWCALEHVHRVLFWCEHSVSCKTGTWILKMQENSEIIEHTGPSICLEGTGNGEYSCPIAFVCQGTWAQWLRSFSNFCSCFMGFLHIIPHLVLLQVFEVYWCSPACDLFKNPCKFNAHWCAYHTCETLFCVFQLCHLQTTRTSCQGQAWKIYSLEQHW